jgi:hypothetical protein
MNCIIRFLGLRVDGVEPIPAQGLNIYLAALARAQARGELEGWLMCQ